MDEVLVASDVGRRYGDTVALDSVSLTATTGEVLALVGPNGAGKTTLVRALTGTTDATGEVRLFGQSPRTVARDRIGLLPQSFSPHERLTARELLEYYAGLYDDTRDVEAVLDDVGLTDTASTTYENLSGGQQRRACVATALINDPDLLVLDEPTTGIDPAGRRDLWRLLEGLADRGVTILVTTHYMEEAQRLADRVGLLADGTLIALDSPDQLVAEHGGDSQLIVDGTFDEAAVSAIDYPAETAIRNGRLVVYGIRPESIGNITEQLGQAGIEYDSLTWKQPDLEDVYLELTGTAVGQRGEPRRTEPAAGGVQ
ncbi:MULTISPECIES: ABC transporter ATP-binding protein [unclassified Haloarcula]|uniref:ABC transporter ATP-binding protein n=1 Tax=unclassified Haloarcula TaxID=2624677 RepID=UPI000678FA72|nr:MULTISPECIES: ABC transporter ATP-binding protein [unclassified Haloarcula]KZX48100.1 ABC transporter ATP-binding protein [Haloarcula sp. K1]MUV51282.1 ATP-binding cassette domain-containing protein [Haloarcula sp. CBA1122]